MRKNIDRVAIFSMVLICGVWGCQQVAIKAVAQQISPMLQVGIRSAIAAAFIYLLFNRKDRISQRLKDVRVLLPGLAVGILVALEFLLVVIGIRMTSTSHTTLFLYTAPLFTAVGLHFLIPEERLTKIQWAGIVLAFGGLLIAVRFTSVSQATDSKSLIGDICAIVAGMSWGLTSIIIRSSALSTIPSSCTLFYQLITTAVILILAALFSGQTAFVITPASLASMVFQTAVVAFIMLSGLVYAAALLSGFLAGHLNFDDARNGNCRRRLFPWRNAVHRFYCRQPADSDRPYCDKAWAQGRVHPALCKGAQG